MSFVSRCFDFCVDGILGVETSKWVEATQLKSTHIQLANGTRYQPTPYIVLYAVFSQLKRFQINQFIDYGCGKGRCLLVASRFGYKDIMGVEIDAELCRLAEANCGTRARIVHGSADDLVSPDKSSIHFFFQPFNWQVMGKLLKKSIVTKTSRQLLVFINPIDLDKIERLGFRLVESRNIGIIGYRYAIYSN